MTYSNDQLNQMREFLANQDQYLSIKLRGDLIHAIGKDLGFNCIQLLMEAHGTDLRSINFSLQEILNNL